MSTLALSTRCTAQVTATAGQVNFAANFPPLPEDGPPFIGLYMRWVAAATGVVTILSQGVGSGQFQVAGPSSGGFTAVLNTPAAAGDLYQVFGLLPAARSIAQTPGGAIYSEILEEDADSFQAQLQELRRDLSAAISCQLGDAPTLLPPLAGVSGTQVLAIVANQVALIPLSSLLPDGSSAAAAAAEASATAAADSATTAGTDATNAAGSATTATTEAGVATTEAAAAAASATAAAASAVTAASYTGPGYTPLNKAGDTATDLLLAAGNLNEYAAGFLGTPINEQDGNYTFVAADAGCMVRHNNAGAHDWTVPPNSSVDYPPGAGLRLRNTPTSGIVTLEPGAGVTLFKAGFTTSSSTIALAAGALATLTQEAANTWIVSGTGIS